MPGRRRTGGLGETFNGSTSNGSYGGILGKPRSAGGGDPALGKHYNYIFVDVQLCNAILN